MNDFFKTLFKWNWANVGKGLFGAASSILMYAATSNVTLPPNVALTATIITGIGAALGLHKAHSAEPPKLPLGS